MPAGRWHLARFRDDADGAMTVLGMFVFLAVLTIAGFALDVANAYRVRTQLQIAGDAAAHAALVAREFKDRATAINLALDIADANLPGAVSSGALRAEDIVFGHWDPASQTFKPDPTATNAVLVNTGRSQDRHNSLSTYLLRFAGVNAFDVRRQTVFETYRPDCFREGIVGDGAVKAALGAIDGSSLCIHSNTELSVAQQTIVPDQTWSGDGDDDDASLNVAAIPTETTQLRSLEPVSDANTGTEPSGVTQTSGTFLIRILARVDDIIAGVRDPGSDYYRDYIDSEVTVALSKESDLDATAFTAGRIHTLTCGSEEEYVSIPADTILSNLVLWTNCRLFFGANVALEDAAIVNESTSNTAFYAPSGIRLGRDEQCAEGGGAQLVTRGGIDVKQPLRMYGGQMIAAGDITFSAGADGLEGASFVGGGMISGDTGSSMTVCAGRGMEDNFEADYFRLAF